MEAKELQKQLETLKGNFYEKINEEISPLREAMDENQKAIDNLLSLQKANNRNGYTNKTQTFGEAFAEAANKAFESKQAEIKAFQNDRDAKLVLELKTVGTMTTSGNITGDPWQTYSNRQGIIPAQKVNARDLIPTTISPSGQYIHYRETGGEGSVGEQVEGYTKSELDFDLTEVKTVSKYVAGFTRFSKQFMKALPFFETTLPRLLLREYFIEENNQFQSAMSTANGFSTSAETDDVKKLLDILGGRADQNYNNSFIVCNHTQHATLLKLIYITGYYPGSGSVTGTPMGNISFAGTPVIPASWVPGTRVMIIDNDFIERVETESLRIEFSYDDGDNFTKNLITARIECFEEFNLIRTDAHSYLEL